MMAKEKQKQSENEINELAAFPLSNAMNDKSFHLQKSSEGLES
jgi:hypothetical protein